MKMLQQEVSQHSSPASGLLTEVVESEEWPLTSAMCCFLTLKMVRSPLGGSASHRQLGPLSKVAGNDKDALMNSYSASVTFWVFFFSAQVPFPFFYPTFKDYVVGTAIWGQRQAVGRLRLWVLQGSRVRHCPPTPASPASLHLSAVPPPPSFLTLHPGCFLTVVLVTVPRASLRSSLFFPDPLSSRASRSCHVFFELTKR